MTQYAQILTQRVHDLHAALAPALFVIRGLGQRVIQYLVETLCGQLLGDLTTQFLRIGFDTVGQTGVQLLWELDVVVSVYTEYIFHYIALPLYIYAVTRYLQVPALAMLGDDRYLQRFEDGLDGLLADRLTDQAVHALNIDRYSPRLEIAVHNVRHVHRHRTTGYFPNEQGSTLQNVQRIIRIATALVAERSVRL